MGWVTRSAFIGIMLNGQKIHGKDDGDNEKNQAAEGRKNDGVTAGLGIFGWIRSLFLGKEARLR